MHAPCDSVPCSWNGSEFALFYRSSPYTPYPIAIDSPVALDPSVNRKIPVLQPAAQTARMDAFTAKMKADGLNEAAIAAFAHNYDQLVKGVTGLVPESDIEAVKVRSKPFGGPTQRVHSP